jgi:DNA-binding NtrC family response regulator
MRRVFSQPEAPRPDQVVALIVDDEPIVRDVVSATLQTAGFFVLIANGGEEALGLSRKFDGTIHVLVSDIIMPKLDGLGLRKQILRERPSIKVLLLSGQVDQTLRGFPILRKPFHLDVLKERVLDMLGSQLPK